MAERSRVIFGNPVGEKAYRKAVQSKQKYLKRFGDDSEVSYPVTIQENPVIGELLGVQDIRVGSGTAKMAEETGSGLSFDQEKGLLSAISVWDSGIIAFPWQSHQRLMPWVILPIGWI